MSDRIDLAVTSSFQGTGLQSAENAARKAAASFDTLSADQQKAATQALRSAQDYARLAAAMGQPAQGAAQLRAAFEGAAGASERQAIAIQRQVAQLDNAASRMSQASGSANAFKGAMESLGTAANGVVNALGTVGIALGAGALLHGAADLVQLGAQAEQTSIRFQQLSAAAGQSGDAILAALRKASGGTISDLNLQLAANRAQLLGVAHSAEEFSAIMVIARDRAQQMGTTTTEAFNDIVTGLGRGSKLILDNLGIIIDTAAANEAYAKSIGKTVSALTDEEKKQALINQVLKDGQATIAATGGAAETTATKIERLNTSIDNLKARLGGGLATVFGPSIEGLNRLTGSAEDQAAAFDSLASSQKSWVGSAINGIPVFGNLIGAAQNLAKSTELVRGTTVSATLAEREHAAATAQQAAAAQNAARAEQERQAALSDTRAEAIRGADQAQDYAQGLGEIRTEARGAAQDGRDFAAATEEARAAMSRAATQGAADLGRALQTTGDFFDRLASTQQQAQQKIEALQQDRAGAKTNKERAAIDERIAAAQAGYQKEIESQAAAYAEEEAAQRAHLGRMLIEYAQAQAQINGVGAEQTKALTDKIAAEFGVQQSLSDRTFDAMQQDIQAWAQSGGQNADIVASALDNATDQAANLQRVMDEAAKERRVELITDFENGKIDAAQLTEALAKVPSEIATRYADNFPAGTKRANALQQSVFEIERNIRTQYGDDFPNGALRAMALEESITRIPVAVHTQADDNLDQVTRHANDATAAINAIPKETTVRVNVQTYVDKVAREDQAFPEDSGSGSGGTGSGLQSKRLDVHTAGAGPTVAGAIQTLNDAAEIIKVIKPFVASNKGALSVLNAYVLTVRGAVSVLTEIQDLRERLVMPAPVLDVKQVERLRDDVQTVVQTIMTIDMSAQNKVRVLAKFLELETAAIDILNKVVDLRSKLAEPTTPINGEYVRQLFNEVVFVTGTLLANMPRLVQREIDLLKSYRDGSANAISIIQDAADLRKALAEPQPPIDAAYVMALARDAASVVRDVQTALVPLTAQQVDALKRYQDGAGAAISVLKDTIDLGRDLGEPIPRIGPGMIRVLRDAAHGVLLIMEESVVPETDETVAAMRRYADGAGAAISILKDTIDLGKALGEPVPPITEAAVTRLADDAKRVTNIVLSRLVPISDQQADAAKRFAETEGAAIEAIKNVLDLPAKMFTDYQSPSDAQIRAVVADADRILRAVDEAARAYDTKGLEAGKAFAEGVGATFSAFKDGLLFFQALNTGDFVPDPKNLAIFEKASMVTIDIAGRLGARAATIPPENITALQNVTSALTAQYESLIKLAAVPFGNLPQLTGQYAASGGGLPGGGGMTVNVYGTPGMDVNQLADAVARKIQSKVTARR